MLPPANKDSQFVCIHNVNIENTLLNIFAVRWMKKF